MTVLKAMNPNLEDHKEVRQAEEVWLNLVDGVTEAVKEGLMDLKAEWIKMRNQDPPDMSCPISGTDPIADGVTLDA